LRGEIADFPVRFSGGFLLTEIAYAIRQGRAREYPIIFHTGMEKKTGDPAAENFQQLSNWLSLNLNMLDEEILMAEYEMQKNGEFGPELDDPKMKSPHDEMFEAISNLPGILSEGF